MTVQTNCVARIKFLNGNSIVAPLTVGTVYEVAAWVGNGSGLQALIVDDNGAVYVTSNTQDPVQWTVVSL